MRHMRKTSNRLRPYRKPTQPQHKQPTRPMPRLPQKTHQHARRNRQTLQAATQKQSRKAPSIPVNQKTEITRAHQALATIQQLLPYWETNQQLRETSDPNTPSAQPNPETLPFGLDKNLNTPNHTRTYMGAIQKLKQIKQEWAAATKTRLKPAPVTIQLLLLLPNAYDKLPVEEWNRYVWEIEKLAHDAETHTGHAPNQLTYPCLKCGTPLQQAYIDTGRLDVYICPTCWSYYTPTDYLEQAKTLAASMPINCLVTMSQAAQILNQPLGTLHARIKRAQLQPKQGRGKNAKYELREIKTLQATHPVS